MYKVISPSSIASRETVSLQKKISSATSESNNAAHLLVNVDNTKAVGNARDKNTGTMCENATGKKDEEEIHARLPAQVAAYGGVKIFRWCRVAGQEDGKDAVSSHIVNESTG